MFVFSMSLFIYSKVCSFFFNLISWLLSWSIKFLELTLSSYNFLKAYFSLSDEHSETYLFQSSIFFVDSFISYSFIFSSASREWTLLFKFSIVFPSLICIYLFSFKSFYFFSWSCRIFSIWFVNFVILSVRYSFILFNSAFYSSRITIYFEGF